MNAISPFSKPPSRALVAVANFLSLLGHPLVLLPLTIALTLIGNVSPSRLLTIVAIFTASTVVPMLFIIRRKVAAGTWTDMDVSDHGQRGHLYTVALAITAVSIAVFWLLDLPRGIIAGAVISLILLLAGMAINRYSKISMHAMFGSYCVVILSASNPMFGLGAFALVAAMSWSRVVLGRHSLAQVIMGNLLGAAAGILLVWCMR